MTPQEKYAEDLIRQYLELEIVTGTELFQNKTSCFMDYYSAAKCALISVKNSILHSCDGKFYSFLQEVKQILESKLK